MEHQDEVHVKAIVVDHTNSGLSVYDGRKERKEGTTKLLLQNNRLASVVGLQTWKDTLTFADFSNNSLEEIPFFATSLPWPQLRVIKVSQNKLRTLSSTPASSFPQLCALLLNDNDLDPDAMASLPPLPQLNTLVISKNPRLRLLAPVAERCPSLTKLSASHTAAHSVPAVFGSLGLKELRLSHTKVSKLAEVAQMPQLQIIDLKDAPICGEQRFEQDILASMPQLRVLNGKNLRPPELHRKARSRARAAQASSEPSCSTDTLIEKPSQQKSSHKKPSSLLDEAQKSSTKEPSQTSRSKDDSSKTSKKSKKESDPKKRDRAEQTPAQQKASQSGIVQHTQVKRPRKRESDVKEAVDFLHSSEQPILKW